MDRFINMLEFSGRQTLEYSVESMGLSLLLAFILGQLIAWVYLLTHGGLSYSRTFTQSLVLLTMVVSLVMFVIGDSIITAFGLIGALAIIRFRNVLKDTRDTVFVFFALVLGMALGSQRHLAAILGATALLLVTLYLHMTSFGSRGRYDGHLNCRVEADENSPEIDPRWLYDELRHFCRKLKQISKSHHGKATDYVFQVALRDRRRSDEMIRELHSLEGMGNVSLVLCDELAEV